MLLGIIRWLGVPLSYQWPVEFTAARVRASLVDLLKKFFALKRANSAFCVFSLPLSSLLVFLKRFFAHSRLNFESSTSLLMIHFGDSNDYFSAQNVHSVDEVGVYTRKTPHEECTTNSWAELLCGNFGCSTEKTSNACICDWEDQGHAGLFLQSFLEHFL